MKKIPFLFEEAFDDAPLGRILMLILFFLTMTLHSGYSQTVQEAGGEDLKLGGSNEIQHSGTYRDFSIPEEAKGKYLYLAAKGGDGGRVTVDLRVGKGGEGAVVSGYFKVGSKANAIPVGATLRFIVANKGTGYKNHGQKYQNKAGGGGGGTGILFLPPHIDVSSAQAEDWVILLVAGGGGGGRAAFTNKTMDGRPGNDGERGTGINTSPVMAYGDEAAAYPQWQGEEYPYGGGGTGIEMIHDVISENKLLPEYLAIGGKLGGFQWVESRLQPVGSDGGQNDNPGGYGFGAGGGGGYEEIGGGGGYGGGNGGYWGDFGNEKRAGGGGSYVNATFALDGTMRKLKTNTTRDPQPGYAVYQFLEDAPLVLGRGKRFIPEQLVLRNDQYKLTFQGDGNLVLRNLVGEAIWASGTSGKGASHLSFQADGNLVIYSGSEALWATSTADNQQEEWGGQSLTMLPGGKVVIANVYGKSIWESGIN